MEKTYSMQSRIRFLQGRVDVNYYNDDSSDTITLKCPNDSQSNINHYFKQMLNGGLKFDGKAAVLSGSGNINGNNCNLDEDYFICSNGGKDDKCSVGWYGTEVADENGVFKNEQVISLEFGWERELDYMVICGDNLRGEYPLEFELYYTNEEKKVPQKIEFTVENRSTRVEVEFDSDYIRNEIVAVFKPQFAGIMANKIELRISKWSAGNTVAKINYFSSEHIESYLGDKLKSISIIEEKTGDTDKLSYGISSNSCNFEFLNENKRFYYNRGYSLLRKNRRVYPYIRCGKGPLSEPLGVFYSEEWKIEDGNPYVTCKAYDVLYPLQDLIINYGMRYDKNSQNEKDRPDENMLVSAYTNQTIEQIFDRVFKLINEKRRANGIFTEIEHVLDLNGMEKLIIPIVLIEEKSAWDVLQDLANLTCSYIYCNRFGEVVISADRFAEPQLTHRDTANLVSINPKNSFSYSLPVLSQTVVNSVNTEYYELEELKDKEAEKAKEFEVKEYSQDKSILTLNLNLDKVYTEIEEAIFEFDSVRYIANKVIVASHKNLRLEFSVPKTISGNISVILTTKKIFNIAKKSICRNENTINKFGLRQFDYKAGNLLLSPNVNIGGSRDESKVFNYQNKVGKILDKYKNGVTFVDAEWIGDYDLTLGNNFSAKSQYDDDGIEEIYECMSSEITYDTKFRQKTKGREVVEIVSD